MTKVIELGGRGYWWMSPARSCARCKDYVTRGIVRTSDIGREAEKDFRVVCWSCFYDMAEEGAE